MELGKSQFSLFKGEYPEALPPPWFPKICLRAWFPPFYILCQLKTWYPVQSKCDNQTKKLISKQPTSLFNFGWQQTNISLSPTQMIILVRWLQWTICILWHIMILIIILIIVSEMIRRYRKKFVHMKHIDWTYFSQSLTCTIPFLP